MHDERLRHLTRNTAPTTDLMVARGEGEHFVSDDGRKILDFCSQTLNLNLGHCHPAVNEALREAMSRVTFVTSRLGSVDTLALAEALTAAAPVGLDRVNLKVSSGSLANEGALKMAYRKKGCQGVVSLMGSHHGESIETMRISGKNFDRVYLRRDGVHFVEPCRCGLDSTAAEACTCADPLADVLAQHGDSIAAVIMEPILVDAGVLVPSRRFLADVRAHTAAAGVALVFDEIQTAFGWLGCLFASELYGVTPDIVTLGKGLACSLPLAAILTSEAYDVLDYGEHEIGPGGNQLLCAVAHANLTTLLTTDLLAEVREKGALLQKLLEELRAELPGIVADVRGVGLLQGVELHDDSPDSERTRRLTDVCLDAGLLVRTSKIGKASNVLQVKPPLIVRQESLERGVELLRDAIEVTWR